MKSVDRCFTIRYTILDIHSFFFCSAEQYKQPHNFLMNVMPKQRRFDSENVWFRALTDFCTLAKYLIINRFSGYLRECRTRARLRSWTASVFFAFCIEFNPFLNNNFICHATKNNQREVLLF